MRAQAVDCYRCSSCGKIWADREIAERCCVCRTCGRPITEKAWGSATICRECWDKDFERIRREKWERAEKVRWDEYDGDGIYIEGLGPEYFWSWHPSEIVDEWESRNEDPFPGFDTLLAFGTRAQPIELDADQLEQWLNEESYEDYEVDGRMHRDLVELCDEWNSKWGDKSYLPDESVAIVWEEER